MLRKEIVKGMIYEFGDAYSTEPVLVMDEHPCYTLTMPQTGHPVFFHGGDKYPAWAGMTEGDTIPKDFKGSNVCYMLLNKDLTLKPGGKIRQCNIKFLKGPWKGVKKPLDMAEIDKQKKAAQKAADKAATAYAAEQKKIAEAYAVKQAQVTAEKNRAQKEANDYFAKVNDEHFHGILSVALHRYPEPNKPAQYSLVVTQPTMDRIMELVKK